MPPFKNKLVLELWCKWSSFSSAHVLLCYREQFGEGCVGLISQQPHKPLVPKENHKSYEGYFVDMFVNSQLLITKSGHVVTKGFVGPLLDSEQVRSRSSSLSTSHKLGYKGSGQFFTTRNMSFYNNCEH